MAIPGVSVMVLDDQSPDGTGAVADALGVEYPGRVTVLHRTGQRGLGVSYLEGFQRAIAGDWDFVVPDGRRPVARSEVPARDERDGRQRARIS